MTTGGIVLILGSAPNAVACRAWPRDGISAIVALNNAWRIRPDWDYLVTPEDFPADRCPARVAPTQRLIGASDYVPANNDYGGVLYAGGTMAFSAGYWALAKLRPQVLAFLGCDMIYSGTGATHFYGSGTADPLREDISLRSLEAKSARLRLLAAAQGCACVRLSQGPSRLLFPSVARAALPATKGAAPPGDGLSQARAMENALGYAVPSGRYWQAADRFDPARIDDIDAAWLRALSRYENASALGEQKKTATTGVAAASSC